jgi:hypothetical protein
MERHFLKDNPSLAAPKPLTGTEGMMMFKRIALLTITFALTLGATNAMAQKTLPKSATITGTGSVVT